VKTITLLCCAFAFFFAGCSKETPNTNPPVTSDAYLNTTAGSTWTYHEDNSSGATPTSSDYTVTSTDKDSTVGSRKYHIYNFSYGGSRYLNISGNDYYQFDSIAGSNGTILERIYLKDNLDAGATWSQDFNINYPGLPVTAPLKITNKIVEKGISRTVNSIEYKNVIHVSTSLSSSVIPEASLTSAIDSYYAPKYGLIEGTTKINLNFLGISQKVDVSTQLKSAVLK
jgi:hypothetical protein